MASSQEKIAVYNLADLKNTSDDAIPNYLNSLKFKQSHHLTDVRLALGYTAFAISAACFMWDYKFGFESTKHYSAVAVTLYTILNGALTFWIWAKEKGIVYVGTAPSGETISIATSTKKNTPVYNLSITIQPPSKSANRQQSQTITLARPFADWFDSAGRFIAPPFQAVLATAIPAVGRLDPKRVASSPAPAPSSSSDSKYTPEMLDALAAATAADATGADAGGQGAGGKKGGKRRKAQ
ncbi:putative signal peptidase [Phialemonium atrogriseum]|uniref:Signal peptidase complex subunit 2 n=1 Tax=Phialemonium atrogriseum TaxID=1093897 RepID=A0AAJ0BYS4_9PEZI|nr:putative signal peptidase [Phialemonium atrogriseum]KAK1764571.1 putative signal peptidase [Phialemonium atrogriseum]